MTTTQIPALRPQTAPATGSRARRFGSLVKGETRMLLRNRTAVFTALVLPFFTAALFAGLDGGAGLGVSVAAMLFGTGLLFVVYYTMVTSLVARREQLVLKRLRAGEPTRMEILLALAVPLWVILTLQTALGIGLAVVVLDAPVTHGWALLPALLGGTFSWTALAVWSSTWTRTVEAAQLTTLPFMLVSLVLSGLSVPLTMLPAPLERLAHLMPMTAVVDLLHLGFTGTGTGGQVLAGADALGAAGGMVLVLIVWTCVAVYEGLRAFRWDARS